MLTKKQFAECIIVKFCKEEGLGREDLCEDHIFRSSPLAVAMEYLGLIEDQELKDYAASRDGCMICEYLPESDNVVSLTVREVLELLPE